MISKIAVYLWNQQDMENLVYYTLFKGETLNSMNERELTIFTTKSHTINHAYFLMDIIEVTIRFHGIFFPNKIL